MFTGIVQGTGEIVSAKDHNALRTIQIEFPAGFMDGIAIGGGTPGPISVALRAAYVASVRHGAAAESIA